jgi:hypothetical protein
MPHANRETRWRSCHTSTNMKMEGLMLPTTRYTTENEMEGLVLPTNRDDVAVNRLHVERWTGWCICRSVDGKMDKSGYMPHANAGGAGYMSFG